MPISSGPPIPNFNPYPNSEQRQRDTERWVWWRGSERAEKENPVGITPLILIMELLKILFAVHQSFEFR